MASSITVPDFVSLSFAQARVIAEGGGLQVQGVHVDGTPVEPESERIVIDQEPLAGESLRSGDTLLLRVGRPPDDSGDRQPADPGPAGHFGDVDPVESLTPRLRDPDAPAGDDPDLVPA